jgi:hypothetical protein
MILNSYISEQLIVARGRDLRETAQRERLAGQARSHDRHWIQPHMLRPGVRGSCPIDSSRCGSTPGIATS